MRHPRKTPTVTLDTYALPALCSLSANTMAFSVPQSWLAAYFRSHHLSPQEFFTTYTYDDSELIAYVAHTDGVLSHVIAF